MVIAFDETENLKRMNAFRWLASCVNDPLDDLRQKMEEATESVFIFLKHYIDIALSAFDMLGNIFKTNDDAYEGLGVCYRSISLFFAKERFLKIARISRMSKIILFWTNRLFFRKTNRGTKFPVRFKGWKGGR